VPIFHRLRQPSRRGGELLSLAEGLELKDHLPPGHLPAGLPRLLHCGLGLAEDAFAAGFKPLGELLSQGGIELFSCDLGPSAARRLGWLPLSGILSRSRILARSRGSIELIRKSYQGPIAAENYNYYPSGLYEGICEPEAIGELLSALDLGLVLDLAHAAISARHLGLDLYQYVDELPLERVVEIHVSKPRLPKDPRALSADAHLEPGPVELGLLSAVLARLERRLPPDAPGPWVVLETYGPLPSVIKATAELKALLKGASSGP
jgi:uncharacterized protein (UPF0276 family)